MIISVNNLKEFCVNLSLSNDGDGNEKRYASLVVDQFPNYEVFWKYLVVPATKRIEIDDRADPERIRRRQGLSNDIFDMMAAHYSVFINLAYSQLHLEKYNEPASFEDFYIHLGSAFDLAEEFLQRIYFLLLDCADDSVCQVLERLTRGDFLEMAGDWYDRNYKSIYETYLRKGKPDWLRLPCSRDVLDEYYGNDLAWLEYKRYSQLVRQYRNVIVHSPQMGFINALDSNGNVIRLVPKIDRVQDYRKWSDFFTAMDNMDEHIRDFVEIREGMGVDATRSKDILDLLWQKPIRDMMSILYEQKNKSILGKYVLSS